MAETSTTIKPVWALQAVVLFFIALRLWFDFAVPPTGDEAYYWMWGQHPGWSYFDHPPLDAWLQGLVAAMFGWSRWSLRLLTWVTLGGTLAILWAWAKDLESIDARPVFWRNAAIFLSIPVLVFATVPALHDHLLVFFSLASAFAFHRFARRWEAGGRGVRGLYFAAVLLGLAVLTKYNGALLGIGLAAYVILRPRLRSLLGTPHPYIAALLAIAIQAPVIYWNVVEGMATLRFHFSIRGAAHWDHPQPFLTLMFFVYMLEAIGPLLIIGLVALPFRAAPSGDEAQTRKLVATIFLVGTAIIAIAASFTDVLLHWNIVAYAALAVIGFRLLDRWWLFWPHMLLAALFATSFVANYAIGPRAQILIADGGTASNFGWDEVAARVTSLHQTHPAAFLATTNYTYAAQLGFALHDTSVTAFNALPSQYDLWWQPALHQGEDAIIVADRVHPIAEAAPHFRAVSKLEDVPVVVMGETIWTFELYLGETYGDRLPG